jgi:putative membrane protein
MPMKFVVALAAALLLGACQQATPVATSTPPPPAALVNALPDDRFVGFAQTVNDFEIKSGQLALTRSSNERVRGYASRAVAEYPNAVQSLSRNRSEAGVSFAPDENVRSLADTSITRLNSLQGADFDRAYADAQVRVQTAAVEQYGAYSQNGRSGPLRRYAQEQLPKSQAFLEYANRLAGSR